MTERVFDRESIVGKIGKLLAQAEGTDNEQEASAFLAKAQALMLKWAVAEAEVNALLGKHQRKTPIKDSIIIKGRTAGARPKRWLFDTLMKLNRCDGYFTGDKYYIIGMEQDVNFVIRMFYSIEAQMVEAMRRDWINYVDLHHKTYTQSFILGYVTRVVTRLRAAHQEQTKEVVAENSQALVLLRDIEQEVEDMMPDGISHVSYRVTADRAAHASGSAAGSRANLGGSLPGSRTALPRG